MVSSLMLTVACAGEDGKDGADGMNGADGAQGDNGADGAQGAPGEPGEPGAPGAPGADGANGADGAPGADGANGADGVCAGATALEITGFEGLPEKIYEYQSTVISVVSNAADPAALNLSIVGAAGNLNVSLADNGDGTIDWQDVDDEELEEAPESGCFEIGSAGPLKDPPIPEDRSSADYFFHAVHPGGYPLAFTNPFVLDLDGDGEFTGAAQ